MKRVVSIIIALTFSLICFGQHSLRITPVKELIEQREFRTYCVRASYAGIYDSSKLIFFVNEDDYIIPIRLMKRDLGAEKRFLDLNLQDGEIITVKGMLRMINIDSEEYKGLVDAVIIDDEYADEVADEKELTMAELDVTPKFKGGEANLFSQWVDSQLEYPKVAKENGVQGRVTLQLTIETDGRVTNVKVLRSVDESLDNEAVRVVSKSPRWSPGYLNGKPVRVTYTFPVIFQLR